MIYIEFEIDKKLMDVCFFIVYDESAEIRECCTILTMA